jgi:hypothetical protein
MPVSIPCTSTSQQDCGGGEQRQVGWSAWRSGFTIVVRGQRLLLCAGVAFTAA